MHLLQIDSSILGAASVSRELTAAIVAERRKADPGATIDQLDLAASPVPHFTAADLGAADAVLDRFLAADVVVIGAPMYNFGIPSQLKAWLDRIMVAGKTFEYTAEGPRGLAGDKQVIVAVSRGGLYGAGSPAAAAEHVETYLRAVFGFIGITRLDFVVAEGVQMGPDARQGAIAGALDEAQRLAA